MIDTKTKLYEDIIYKSNLDALKLDILIPYKKIYEELLILKNSMVKQIDNDSWLGATLRGIDSNKPRPYYEYGYKNESEVPYKWTNKGMKCRITRKFILGIFNDCDLYRIKVNVLKPKGKIHLHNDSVLPGLGISDKTSDANATFVSFAIYWPSEVIFNLGKHRVPFKTGDSYLLNFSEPHEVFNPTNEARYYLLVTGKLHKSNNWKNLVIESYNKYKNNKLSKKISLKSYK